MTDSSTNNTVLLENTNASGGSFVQYKNNYGYSWKAGMCGGSVASAGNCFLIKSEDFSGLSSKLQMFSDGTVQLGYNDLTNTSNNRLIIGDIFSGYISFIYGGSETGSIYRNSVGGTAYSIASDYRLKFNVKPVENALSKIMRCNPVSYNFKGYDSQIGYLAHEFAEICPWAVKGIKDEGDKDGKPVYQSMDSKYLIPFLNKASQEQQIMIQELVKKVDKLSKRVSDLEGL